MAFLTEYFDEYRELPIRKVSICDPAHRYAPVGRAWLDPGLGGSGVKEQTDEEIRRFIRATMKELRGQSTYYNEYCAHLSPEFKTRPHVERPKRKKGCKDKSAPAETAAPPPPPPPLQLKDTEVMRAAKALYEQDLEAPTLEPNNTLFRIYGYVRPSLFHTGISEYSGGIARLAYELVRDDRLPRFAAANGNRPRWGIPPLGTRQPELDGIPFESERLY